MLTFRVITSCRHCWNASRVSKYNSGQQRLSWRFPTCSNTVTEVPRVPGRSAFEPMCAPEGIEAVIARLSQIGHGPHPPVEFQQIITCCVGPMLQVIYQKVLFAGR